MIIAVTGHRPPKLGDEWDGVGPISDHLRKRLGEIIDEYKPEKIISGMALGVDMLWAELGIEREIPVVAAVPCIGQSSRWRGESKERYERILADPIVETVLVSDIGYRPWVMQRRNQWMVDHADVLIAVWDGSSGGTGNCVAYARKIGKPIIVIDPRRKDENS